MRTVEKKSSRLGPATRRLIRSYGLLILIALAFLLMAMFIREKEQTVPAQGIGSASSLVAER
jgi:hypothetical protein